MIKYIWNTYLDIILKIFLKVTDGAGRAIIEGLSEQGLIKPLEYNMYLSIKDIIVIIILL